MPAIPLIASWLMGQARGIGANILLGAIGVLSVMIALWAAVSAISGAATRSNDLRWQADLASVSATAESAAAAARAKAAAAEDAERRASEEADQKRAAEARAADLATQLERLKTDGCDDPVLFPAKRRPK